MSITRLRSGLPQSLTEPHVRAKSHTRIQIQPSARIAAASATLPTAGMLPDSQPQSRPAATPSMSIRRSRAHAGYGRPGYLAPSFQGAGTSPPMFRIG